MAIYDRKNPTSNDSTKPSTSDEPKVKTDEKSGPDLAALNANGPGTDQAHKDAAKQDGDDVPDGSLIVAEGKSITSQRGILGPGTAVSEKDVSGGKERLEELEKAGSLVRKGQQRRDDTDQRREPTDQ